MSQTRVESTLHELGNGLFAYIQGDGSWGWSNSGLIISGDESLLIDTLFTGRLTSDMLREYRRVSPAAEQIDVLVNTHANGDHTFGNHMVGGARIIGSTACMEEMNERPAEVFADLVMNWKNHGDVGAFLHETMGQHFDFSDIAHVPPTELFNGRRDITIGDRKIELHEMGPAHTRGDIIVHVPDAKTVYTGDILFSGGHPIVWAGPVQNWIDACDRILTWDVETIVPGHGPIGDKQAVREMRHYLLHIYQQSEQMFAAGLPWEEAAFLIGYDAFDSWLDRERVVANVANIYRDLSKGAIVPDRAEIMRQMLRYRKGADCPHDAPCGCHSKKGNHS